MPSNSQKSFAPEVICFVSLYGADILVIIGTDLRLTICSDVITEDFVKHAPILIYL